VGLGQLDDDEEVHHQQRHEQSHHQPQPQPSDWSNPYFPPVSTPRPAAASVTDSHATRSSPSHSSSISQRNSPIHDHAPGVEFGATSSSPGHSPVRTESKSKSSAHDTPKSMDNDVYAFVIFFRLTASKFLTFQGGLLRRSRDIGSFSVHVPGRSRDCWR
jgi:FtsZ-interacting cell division protein ZipA